MNRFSFLLLNFFGWALLIELALILAYQLFKLGRVSFATSEIPGTAAVLMLFAAILASAVITRRALRRRRLRMGGR